MKKICLLLLACIMSVSLCFGLASCSDNTVEQLQNELGAVLEGGNFKEGSVLNTNKLATTDDQAEAIFKQLEELGLSADNIAKAVIYDIFVTKDNEKIQPDGNVKVTIPLPFDENIKEYNVYHMNGGKLEFVRSAYADGKVTFETNGFSLYAFVPISEAAPLPITPTMYKFTVQCEPNNGGVIKENGAVIDLSGGRTVEENTKITLTAVPNANHRFKGWATSDEKMISTSSTYEFTISENTFVKAVFEETPVDIKNFNITLTVRGVGDIREGDVSVADAYAHGRNLPDGAAVSLTAVAGEKYIFKGWYNSDDTLISTDANYTFKLNKDITAYALFEEKTMYRFTVQCEPNNGGVIKENGAAIDLSGGRTVEPNTKITLTAVPNDNHRFKGWATSDGKIISTSSTYEFTVSENTVVKAMFTEKVIGLKLDAQSAGFTYDNGTPATTVYQIGDEAKPDVNSVVVYAVYPTIADEILTPDVEYTIDLGGLDFAVPGVYTITFTYNDDNGITDTLTVEVVGGSSNAGMTEDEWNAVNDHYKSQTNVKVVERISNPQNQELGDQIMLYMYDGAAYAYDGYFANDQASQDYKGKSEFLVKDGDKYLFIYWGYMNDHECYVKGKAGEAEYNSRIYYDLYSYLDAQNYNDLTYDEATDSYQNGDKSVSVNFTYEEGTLTKIVITSFRAEDSVTFETSITFGDAVIEVPDAINDYSWDD